jgi:hypothetical protein
MISILDSLSFSIFLNHGPRHRMLHGDLPPVVLRVAVTTWFNRFKVRHYPILSIKQRLPTRVKEQFFFYSAGHVRRSLSKGRN